MRQDGVADERGPGISAPGASSGRVLIAGIGNVLRRDDGFGPAVASVLERRLDELPAGTTVLEVGIGGIGLIQELLEGYGGLILVDAVDRGAAPGTLFVLEPDVPTGASMSAAERQVIASDMHQLVPSRSLTMAAAFDVLPPRVRIVGCQPAETEELSTELSPVVRAVVHRAAEAVMRLAHELSGRAVGV